MAKQGKGSKGAQAGNTQAQATPVATTVQVIATVKQGVVYRGARAAWYAVLQQHAGQPVANYIATCKEKPPSLPKSGVAENPTGWLAYFVRSGVATLADAPAQVQQPQA